MGYIYTMRERENLRLSGISAYQLLSGLPASHISILNEAIAQIGNVVGFAQYVVINDAVKLVVRPSAHTQGRGDHRLV